MPSERVVINAELREKAKRMQFRGRPVGPACAPGLGHPPSSTTPSTSGTADRPRHTSRDILSI